MYKRQHSLERVRGRSRFERAAAVQARSGFLYIFRDLADLFSGFNGTGARDDLEVSSADFGARDIHNRVFGMKFAVYVLVRLLDCLYGFHNIQSVDEINVDSGRIADQSKDCLLYTSRCV